MEFQVSRELQAIVSSWSTPQLLTALDSAISGAGPALSAKDLSISTVDSAIALIVSTSGSTGNSKDVTFSGTALRSSAQATNEFLGATSGAIWSLLLPTTHIAGINVLVRAMELETIPVGQDQRADFSAIVPTQLFRALHGDVELFKHLQSCSAVLVGGAPLAPELRERAIESGIRVVTTYGMTESCGGVVYDGKPLRQVEVRIIDGQIAIKAPQLALGYLDGDFPLRDGFFITSDLGEMRDGLLEVLGRNDDLIISGGEKISLGRLDAFLQRSFGSSGIVAFARPDGEWGERLCIASTLKISHEEINRRLKQEFGRHASPKEIIELLEIPILAMGKPDRKKLADGKW